jgi:hypothetical protein
MDRLFDSIPESEDTPTKLTPTSKCSLMIFLIFRRAADPNVTLVIAIVIADDNSVKKGFYYLHVWKIKESVCVLCQRSTIQEV